MASIFTDRYKVIGIKKDISGMDRLCSCQKQKHRKKYVQIIPILTEIRAGNKD